MYPVHKDWRGSFQELAHSSDVMFGQLSILKVNVGCIRGGHYHKRKQEWFCCIHGKCQMDIVNVRDDSLRTLILHEDKSEFVLIDQYEKHSVINISSLEPCELLVTASEEYNPDDPDTFEVGK